MDQVYDSRFSPHEAKPGQRVILFLADPHDSQPTFEVEKAREALVKEIEDISVLADVRRALAQPRATGKKPAKAGR